MCSISQSGATSESLTPRMTHLLSDNSEREGAAHENCQISPRLDIRLEEI